MNKIESKFLKLFKSDKNIILLFIFLGIVLRLYNITRYDIWSDEAASFFRAISSLDKYYAKEMSPSIYFYFLKPWIYLFGSSLLSLRSLSVIFSVASIYPFFRLNQLFFGRKNAIYATLLFVFSPFQIWYAQEARVYSLIVFESVVFFYFLLRFIGNHKRRYLYACLSISLVSFCTDYRMMVFLIFITLLYIKKLNKEFLLLFLSSFFLLLLLSSKIFISLLNLLKELSFWAPEPLWLSPLITFNNFLFSYIRRPPFNVTTLIFTGILVILIIISNGKNKNKTMLKWVVFFPVISIFILSKFIFSVYVDRFFIFVSPFLYILAVSAIRDLNNLIFKKTLSYALSFLIVISLILYYAGWNEESRNPKNLFWYRMHIGTPFKHPYKNVAMFLYNNCREDDYILYSNRDIENPLQYYLDYSFKSRRKDELRKYFKLVCVSGVLHVGHFDRNILMYDIKNKNYIVLIDKEKLPDSEKKGVKYWLLSSKWERGQEFWPAENQTLVREFMLKKYKRIRTLAIDDILIDVFEIDQESPTR